MAFNPFKKKDNLYPSDEKAEVLDPSFPEVSELPPLGDDMGDLPMEDFGEEVNFEDMNPDEFGFRSPEQMRPPPMMQRIPQAPLAPQLQHAPMQQITSSIPPGPEMFSAPRQMAGTKPHIYIRINKYKEVMEAIQILSEKVQETKNDVEELHEIGGNEAQKLRESAEVILKIEGLLKYLETTFRTPEE